MTRKHGRAISRLAGARRHVLLAVVVAVGCVGEVGEHWACHGQTPIVGAPSVTGASAFMAPSRLDPSQSIGTVAIARVQSTTILMPPAPAAPATAAEIAAISNWISAGHPAGGGCRPICTSGMTWTNGNEGSPEEMKSRNGLQRLPFTRPGRIMLP